MERVTRASGPCPAARHGREPEHPFSGVVPKSGEKLGREGARPRLLGARLSAGDRIWTTVGFTSTVNGSVSWPKCGHPKRPAPGSDSAALRAVCAGRAHRTLRFARVRPRAMTPRRHGCTSVRRHRGVVDRLGAPFEPDDVPFSSWISGDPPYARGGALERSLVDSFAVPGQGDAWADGSQGTHRSTGTPWPGSRWRSAPYNRADSITRRPLQEVRT